MIIPIRCMNCGFVLADKYRWYQSRVSELRVQRGLPDAPMVLDGAKLPDTPEKTAMDELGISRQCCRKHLLTHRDLIEKI
jgi:DNA-directed RNA polymerase I, II, and III subunit RPABC5